MISKTIEVFLEKYQISKCNVLVAFSGGYDSMCLLHAIKNLASKYQLNLTAIHLNHNWRGAQSDLEEAKCRDFCVDIDFYSEKLSADIPHTETAAREARYAFFEKCAEKFDANVIFTAHNANDNAETVFYRILKGTGIYGLEGIQEKRDIYYRPILTIYREDIENYCKEYNLTPNIDSSNADTKYCRNRIRNEIFPQLKSISQNFEQKLNSLAKSAKASNNIVSNCVKSLEEYTTKEFCELTHDVQTIVVHKFCKTLGLDYDKKKIEDIVTFILNNKTAKVGCTLSLTTDSWLFVSDKKIEKIEKEMIKPINVKILSTGKYDFNDYIFEIEKCDKVPTKYPLDSENTAYVTLKDIDFDLRTRKNGDIIQPLGLQGTQKLKKYLNEKKISKFDKDKLLFLCTGNEVLWAIGLGISEKIKVTTKPTHILKIRRSICKN